MRYKIITVLILYFVINNIYSQADADMFTASDTNNILVDSIKIKPHKEKIADNAIESKVIYKAKDSIKFNIEDKLIKLYGEAEVNYESINIKAAFIEVDFSTNLLYARGVKDSLGVLYGKPVFTDESSTFESENMTYNFTTKKGLIKHIITKDDGSYIHGERVKRMSDNTINIRNGMYTTCNHPNPHFQIKFTKAKVIPNDKIVTGPAVFCVENVPTPLIVPFGFFPNQKGRSSGIILPRPEGASNRGFGVAGGGYYFGINDYMDFEINGDIYTRGSWAARTVTRYKKRYKYDGNFNFNYSEMIYDDDYLVDDKSELKNKGFSVLWTHKQSPKARPKSKFSANVNASSSSFNQHNYTNYQQRMTNTMQSNISYSARFGKKCNFSTNFRHSQNTSTKKVNLSLPEIAFSVGRTYPFKKKKRVGKEKLYEKVSFSYVMNAKNQLNLADSLLFTEEAISRIQNGIKHSLPVSLSSKLFKVLSWTNSINYTSRWYPESIERNWNRDSSRLETDTIKGIRASHDVSLSTALNFKIYGMVQFKKFPIRAIRHVITPNLRFSLRPNIGTEQNGYYNSYIDGYDREQFYSIFQGSIYGTPSSGKSGKFNLSISNNLEMKVRSKSDTITGMKKIVLIENLSANISNNIFADSLNWSLLTVSGRTRLFKKLNIQYAGVWDPYIKDSNGRYVNKFEWNENGIPLRHSSTSWNLSLNYGISSKDFSKKEITNNGNDQVNDISSEIPKYEIDYSVPWNLNFNYSFRYMNRMEPYKIDNKNIIQTLGFSGRIQLTNKWDIRFRSGYDFINNKISYTTIDIARQLHCWEMRFNWIPIGNYKSYNFTIAAKSTMLQDLKLEKKKDFRNNY